MSGFTFGTPQTTASTGLNFGASNPTAANAGFAFGASNVQQVPAQSTLPTFSFGPSSSTVTPTIGIIASTNTTSVGSIGFGASVPPYGAQTTTVAPSLTFGLGSTTSR